MQRKHNSCRSSWHGNSSNEYEDMRKLRGEVAAGVRRRLYPSRVPDGGNSVQQKRARRGSGAFFSSSRVQTLVIAIGKSRPFGVSAQSAV